MSLDSFKTTENSFDFGIKVENTEDMAYLSKYEKFNINELDSGV